MNYNVHPFIKWAGGKGQLLNQIRNTYPCGLGETITRYCEPFVGGAVLFDVLSNYNLDEIYINDINTELINTYRTIQNDVNALIEVLSTMQSEFTPLDTENRKLYYYEKREQFNNAKVNGDKFTNINKASLFIFLNKTCFNGLYRVNGRGLYNVPMGAYKNPLICDAENLINISTLLQNITINCGDYKECRNFIDERTFVYIDPPYRPLNATASFTSYTETGFGDREQVELAEFVNDLNQIGAKIVVSNSDPQNTDVDDNFFDELYGVYQISRVTAKRMINCNAERRGIVNELLICN
jgi:DNA adenine methylase